MPAEILRRDDDEPSKPPLDSDADFDALVRAHYTRLYNFAYRLLGSEARAQDAVQEVFLKVWKRRAELSMRKPLPYLYQAVRNECVMAIRRDGRAKEVDCDDSIPSTLSADVHESADFAVAAAQAIDALPERCRLVFRMSREQDLSYAEIAQILDISAKTVENQIGRALKILRRRLAGFLCVVGAILSLSAS